MEASLLALAKSIYYVGVGVSLSISLADYFKFETRPSSLRNSEMAYLFAIHYVRHT